MWHRPSMIPLTNYFCWSIDDQGFTKGKIARTFRKNTLFGYQMFRHFCLTCQPIHLCRQVCRKPFLVVNVPNNSPQVLISRGILKIAWGDSFHLVLDSLVLESWLSWVSSLSSAVKSSFLVWKKCHFAMALWTQACLALTPWQCHVLFAVSNMTINLPNLL